jgi:ATP-dependent Zn protease
MQSIKLKNNMKNIIDTIREASRYRQLDQKIISLIYKVIKESTGDTELALTVSLQLQRQNDYLFFRETYEKENFKSVSQKLRELADILDD